MLQFNNHIRVCFIRKPGTICLCLIWLLGLIAGMLCINFFHSEVSCLLGNLQTSLFVLTLPFLISLICVSFLSPVFLYFLCFGKTILFSGVSLLFLRGFGCSGWMVRYMTMLPEILSLPLLYFFWHRHIHNTSEVKIVEVLLILLLYLSIWGIYRSVLTPFFQEVIYL